MSELRGYSSVIGHQENIAMLKNIAAKERVSHAYVFQGEAGIGKMKLVKLFAAALQCGLRSGEPCMNCPSCIKAAGGNHPDIITIRRTKTDSIGVDDIREQIIDTIQIKPYEGKYKIYIIPDASLMTVQAQNALLKSLEEPPKYAVIILVADNVGMLLPTIMSRSMVINVRPVKDSVLKEYLQKELFVPDKLADIYTAIAKGRIGMAARLAGSDEYRVKIDESIYLLGRFKQMNSIELIDYQRKIASNKNDIFDYLDLFTIWFRDVLLYKATKEADSLIFKNEIHAIKTWANTSSYQGIQTIIDAFDVARTRLKANVNPELVLELAFLTMLEN